LVKLVAVILALVDSWRTSVREEHLRKPSLIARFDRAGLTA
jgi:hypothetical protein